MVLKGEEAFHLREPGPFYKRDFDPKNDDIGAENGYFWNNILGVSIS